MIIWELDGNCSVDSFDDAVRKALSNSDVWKIRSRPAKQRVDVEARQLVEVAHDIIFEGKSQHKRPFKVIFMDIPNCGRLERVVVKLILNDCDPNEFDSIDEEALEDSFEKRMFFDLLSGVRAELLEKAWS